MTDHLTRIRDALDRYSLVNRQPAVDEPANDFEKAVNDWDEAFDLLQKLKSMLKPLEASERQMRDGIADSLKAHLKDNLKEGVNSYELSNGRVLKLNHKVNRTVVASMIPAAREAYKEAGGDKSFDDLLRVKYELQIAPWRKLDNETQTAVSRMIVSKLAAPTLEVD